MNPSRFLPAALLLAVAASSQPAALAAATTHTVDRPPNIVFLLADDVGTDWVGCYGSDQPTPNIDRLAAAGVRFTTAWTSPICTPSRTMMLTGQYPDHTGWIEHYDVPRWGGAGLMPEKFATWPQLLHARGYTTAIVGKWQINDLRLKPDILKQHGFDFHCMWPGVEEGNPPSEKRYWDAYLQIDGQRQVYTGQYGPDISQAYALNFIRAQRDRPFLLYYPMMAAHAPNEPTPLNRDHPPVGENALYAGSVTYLDRQIGELLDELDHLGLTQNTVVVFAGDNGSSSPGTHHGRRIPAGKGGITDLGVHVPLIIRAPQLAKSARVSPALADFSDLFPTFLDFAHVKPPAGLTLDGHSLVPVLQESPGYQPRTWIYAQRLEERTVRDERFKLDSSGKMFDLVNDELEKTDVRHRDDPATKAAAEKLTRALDALPVNAAKTPPFPGYTPARMAEYQEQMRKEKKAQD